jgi:hypothetical protein
VVCRGGRQLPPLFFLWKIIGKVIPLLKFSSANTKTKKLREIPTLARYLAGGNKVYSFDLPAGHSCPFAEQCRSSVIETPDGRRIQDGHKTEFRCFSASQEVIYTTTHNARRHNLLALRGLHLNDMIRKLDRNIPDDCGILRLHVSGDFFSPDYMQAWIEIARKYKYILFYAYTKSIPYWAKYRNIIPSNFRLTASYGGVHDDLIRKHRLHCARVVYSVKEAAQRCLPLDNDDSHAAIAEGSFALLLHGIQPIGTAASKAIVLLGGVGGWRKNIGGK